MHLGLALSIAAMLLASSRAFLTRSPARHLSKLHMSTLSGKPFVTVEEAIEAHSDPNVVFVDGSWFLAGRSGRDEYETGPRIQGAVYFDIDDVASKGELLNPRNIKHMMPPKKLFAAAMDAMKIKNSNDLVVYGTQGCAGTQRTWYQLRAMGHAKDRVHLMQGSLDDWKELGGPIEEGPVKAIVADDLDLSVETNYVATDPQNVLGLDDVKKIVNDGESSDAIIIDARARDRFLGLVEEPRPNLRLGHMPGAFNLAFTDLLNPDNISQYKPKSELMEIMAEAGIDVDTDKRIVVSCGSGVTACVVAGALEACGRDPKATFLYDGSWMEWGGEQDTPIVS